MAKLVDALDLGSSGEIHGGSIPSTRTIFNQPIGGHMFKQKGFVTSEALAAVILILGVIGWIMNVIKLISGAAFDFEGIVRVIGIFVAPLGALFGLFWW